MVEKKERREREKTSYHERSSKTENENDSLGYTVHDVIAY